ncbi:Uncharacterised protein [Yersinia nurmii]|uniref:Inner membrane protein n=1 Tax=Yersinia nurmii TaxID=685706 RepID=A0ABP1YC60_9GAMM|nr:hypothetical protein [Yersinia nurmii]CNE48440.1 Uncharacterised protein [Yersinia nurmii]
MDSSKDVAKDMVSVISEEASGGGWLVGLTHGLVDLPVDFFYLGYDFLDTEHRYQNDNDKYRFAELIKSGLANRESIEKILRLVLGQYFDKLDSHQKKKILETKVAKLVGGMITKNILLGDIGAILASRLAFKMASGFVMTSILGLGAMVSRAIYTSRALMEKSPKIYWELRKEGNLDLLYFLVENSTEPFVRALVFYDSDKAFFDDVFEEFIIALEK